MQNRWFSSDRPSALKPQLPMARGSDWRPPPHPPDPPDPSSPLPLGHFPSLGSSLVKPKPCSQTTLLSKSVIVLDCPTSPSLSSDILMGSPSSSIAEPISSIDHVTVQIPLSERGSEKPFTVRVPKASSPLFTNRASCSSPHFTRSLPILAPKPSSNHTSSIPTTKPLPNSATSTSIPNTSSLPPAAFSPPPVVGSSVSQPSTANPKPSTTAPPPIPPPSHSRVPPIPNSGHHPNLAEKLRKSQDRSLKRLAPLSFAESGRPRVLIPDEVFEEGASFLKDLIVCYFNGRAPPFTQIQSALNHLWGKGRRLEINLNPINRTVLVRVPN
ncbi:unnamed protein product [Cochlearia groenlandica]